ncbi:MAG TPA: hypothetical protein VHZ51_18950 [Ktedonobacteraceae bacterium]|jgi:hypothetical protein|nr:hypothetical protein [Ktedonobacteraceae bacterium]
MRAPRVTAAIFVLLLIGIVSLGAIGLVDWIGPVEAHGNTVEHARGTILQQSNGTSFTLLTKSGKQLTFQCTSNCDVQLQHIKRHQTEHAFTDVYYVPGSNHTLIAVDVD